MSIKEDSKSVMYSDSHAHTNYSCDSKTPMREMIERAIQNGIETLTFTEHVDHGLARDEIVCDYASYFPELERLAAEYADKIDIRKGIEFGAQRHTIADFERDFAAHEFDFVILSCHQIDNLEFWDDTYQAGKNQEEINRIYYEEILAVMKEYKHYAVLGHLDVIKRYDPYGIYPDENVMDLVDEILRLAIKDDKGIELNLSNVRYGLPDLTPSRAILKRYRELGGRILTIGSDGHSPDQLMTRERFDEAAENLKALGFREHCVFKGMKPTFYAL